MNDFLPITRQEVRARGWDALDVILITGDAYVDHPAFGTAVIGRVLESAGFCVGIIAMPDWRNPDAITALGKPKLFFGITSGNVDSMIARYTAFKRPRSDDPYAPDGQAGHKPDRAVIVYANLIKQRYKDVPIVIGGIETSMRRFVHYDFWSNKLRRSILLDSKATILAYGMAETAIVEIARRLEKGKALDHIPGTVSISHEAPQGLVLPSEEETLSSQQQLLQFYKLFYQNQHQTLVQPVSNRYLIQTPQSDKFGQKELDKIYDLPYMRAPHPIYSDTTIPAFEMIQHSINAHRGCVSGCSFCSLGLHQGKRIVSRSKKSILREASLIRNEFGFHGQITDIGGPSANMYGYDCAIGWKCKRESCLFPDLCKNLKVTNAPWLDVMRRVAELPRIDKVTVGSGIRYDLFMQSDSVNDDLHKLMVRHISGQLKIAPENTSETVLRAMRKPALFPLKEFINAFQNAAQRAGKKQYLVPYLMTCHPGSSKKNTEGMKRETLTQFGFVPSQVQTFIPLPMTLSSIIYFTGMDPITGESFSIQQDMNKRRAWHEVLLQKKAKRSKPNTQSEHPGRKKPWRGKVNARRERTRKKK